MDSGPHYRLLKSIAISEQERVVSIAKNPKSGWDAILIASEGERWWWWFGMDSTFVTNSINNHNSRLIDLTTYIESGVRKYAVVELDDSNPEQAPVNSASARVRTNAESNGWKGGFHGAYAAARGQRSPITRISVSNQRVPLKFCIRCTRLRRTCL